eukprot:scaffold1083_cov114-Cylindrotheca_fusiformis.AAC.13
MRVAASGIVILGAGMMLTFFSSEDFIYKSVIRFCGSFCHGISFYKKDCSSGFVLEFLSAREPASPTERFDVVLSLLTWVNDNYEEGRGFGFPQHASSCHPKGL